MAGPREYSACKIELPTKTIQTTHELLKYLRKITGERLTLSDFMATALKYYLQHITGARSDEAALELLRDLIGKGRESIEGPGKGPGSKD